LTCVGVGLIVPSSNTCLEPLVARLFADDPARLHVTRLRVTRIGLDGDASSQFAPASMLAAAGLLADAGVDVICWGGTSGSWLGIQADRDLCRRLSAATGVPATTSTLAVLGALQALGIDRVGLAVPYTSEVGTAIAAGYAETGLSCPTTMCLGIERNADFADVPAEVIDGLVRSAAVPEVQGVAVVCTNRPATDRVAALEAELGLPVVDSIAATVWQLRRLLGWTTPIAGRGALLAGVLAPT
jgi:maleate isomerase